MKGEEQAVNTEQDRGDRQTDIPERLRQRQREKETGEERERLDFSVLTGRTGTRNPIHGSRTRRQQLKGRIRKRRR